MNPNEEKNTGRNGLIIVYKSSVFHYVGQKPKMGDNCSLGCKKVCQIKLETFLKIYLRLGHRVLIVPRGYPTKAKIKASLCFSTLPT